MSRHLRESSSPASRFSRLWKSRIHAMPSEEDADIPMALPCLRIKRAIESGMLDDNLQHPDDQEIVLSFMRLRGRSSRPVDRVVVPRSRRDFERLRAKLPVDFFTPLYELLALLNRHSISVQPDADIVAQWNRTDFTPSLTASVIDRLDSGGTPRLVPTLVALFYNLERDRLPSSEDWNRITAISIPGCRSFDRAAEGFRAYLQTGGKALLITSGRAPHYDPDNAGCQVSESEASAAYLRLLGVPGNRIFCEASSNDTVENADFLVHVIDEIAERYGTSRQSVLLTTSPFHLARYRLSVELRLEGIGRDVEVFASASRAGKFAAENYFLADATSGYPREHTVGVVVNEYLKIAYDLCTMERPFHWKGTAAR